MSMLNSCPGSKALKSPTPEPITCSGCGEELEIWTDELKVRCKKCGTVTYKDRMPSCIDWCKHAESCIGSKLYKELKLS